MRHEISVVEIKFSLSIGRDQQKTFSAGLTIFIEYMSYAKKNDFSFRVCLLSSYPCWVDRIRGRRNYVFKNFLEHFQSIDE